MLTLPLQPNVLLLTRLVLQASLLIASPSFQHQALHFHLNVFSLCSCLRCSLSLYIPKFNIHFKYQYFHKTFCNTQPTLTGPFLSYLCVFGIYQFLASQYFIVFNVYSFGNSQLFLKYILGHSQDYIFEDKSIVWYFILRYHIELSQLLKLSEIHFFLR